MRFPTLTPEQAAAGRAVWHAQVDAQIARRREGDREFFAGLRAKQDAYYARERETNIRNALAFFKANPRPDPHMKLKIEVETAALQANLHALIAMTGKTSQQCVKETAIMLLQSGSNIVPEAKQKKRDILRVVRRYRRGVEEIVKGARPSAPGDKLLFLIPRPRNRRAIAKSGDRRFWVFESLERAKEHQSITFRGVAKAGFWSQYPALGRSIPAKYAKQDFLASVPGLKMTQAELDTFHPSVTISNRSTAIGFDKATHWKTEIMSKVTNRIAGMAKPNEQRLAAFRKAGGVTWDAQAGIYEGVEP